MKVLVFAHTPPPHHGQSYMVKLFLEGMGGDWRGPRVRSEPAPEIECYHVNCRYSENLGDIGSFRLEKMWLVFRYCLEAIWCRFRYGVKVLYYVPAPGKRGALYRDWVVMALCRPFFTAMVLHWHAVGLGDWLRANGSWIERWLTHRLLSGSTVSIALAVSGMRDALWFRSRRVEIVANGIADPCPDFAATILPRRLARIAARRMLLAGQAPAEVELEAAGSSPEVLEVFFLAHCTRDKGIFDTIDGVLIANELLRRRNAALKVHLTIAGGFLDAAEEEEFHASIARAPLEITYAGFVREEAKATLFARSDVFCFPTYYAAEGQPVSVIEAIAFGVPVVTTRWRGIPEILPPEQKFVPLQSPEKVAEAILDAAAEDGSAGRREFLDRYALTKHLADLRTVLKSTC